MTQPNTVNSPCMVQMQNSILPPVAVSDSEILQCGPGPRGQTPQHPSKRAQIWGWEPSQGGQDGMLGDPSLTHEVARLC